MKYLPLYFLCLLTSCSEKSEPPPPVIEVEPVGEYTGKTVERFPYKISTSTEIITNGSKSKIYITALYGSKPTIERFAEYLIYGRLELSPYSKEHIMFGAGGATSIPGLEQWFYPKQAISNFTLGTSPYSNLYDTPTLVIATFVKGVDGYKYTLIITNKVNSQGERIGQGKGLPKGEGAKSLSDLKSRLTGKK